MEREKIKVRENIISLLIVYGKDDYDEVWLAAQIDEQLEHLKQFIEKHSE